MHTIHASGIDIRYAVTGSGPWLVLSHALGCDLSLWDEQVAALAPHFTVLRFDSRGHGGSSAPGGAYDFDMLTADVLGLMDGLGVARTHFLGLSMGGMLGQHLALAAPQRVASLVLASTTSSYPPEARAMWPERIHVVAEQGMEPMVAPTLERWFTAPYRAAHPEVMARIGALIRATPPAGYCGWGHAIAAIDTTARLGVIANPTLVIAGAQDAGTPPDMARVIAQAIPGARLEVIESASHLCCVEQAEVFNRLVEEFLGAKC
ncbi:MAG: 3-oxoadipate enol-lactonase [Betaproteobacteria bacterium]|nr:3-oxoadipate enol-lactonase [Betaproteobacteria bacterium]